jgi:hypothetical protein
LENKLEKNMSKGRMTTNVENQIDQLTYKLYNLTPEEIKIG